MIILVAVRSLLVCCVRLRCNLDVLVCESQVVSIGNPDSWRRIPGVLGFLCYGESRSTGESQSLLFSLISLLLLLSIVPMQGLSYRVVARSSINPSLVSLLTIVPIQGLSVSSRSICVSIPYKVDRYERERAEQEDSKNKSLRN